jgi:hypothetical protein
MKAFHRCFLPSFSSFGWGVLEAYLSVIQFIANCILLIFIFKLELSPFPQKNSFFSRKHTIINMNHLWKVLYKECSFRPDLLTNMAATGDSCFWLADFKNSSPRKLFGQMYRTLVGSIYGRSSVAIAYKQFPRRRIFKISQSETRIACGSHVC